jgi:hypothetical protein
VPKIQVLLTAFIQRDSNKEGQQCTTPSLQAKIDVCMNKQGKFSDPVDDDDDEDDA